MQKETILTGIRSNEEPTLGNYLGAFLPMVDLAKKYAGDYQINMFVPDLHSFTTPIDHSKLFNQSMRNIKLFVASGLPLDNQDVYIYRQSYVSAHSELAWILSCFTGYGEISRMVEFKDKSKREGSDRVSAGLLNYPILMAADILLYKAKWVPVGEDQRQHLEFTRDLAIRMNNKFGNIFVVPNDIKAQQAFIDRDSAPRIRSLRNPDKKMSKSINDPAGTILLNDIPAEAAKKVMSATTDSLASINFDWQNQPGITNLLQILALLTKQSQAEVNSQWATKSNYGDLKRVVASQIESSLSELQNSYNNIDETALLDKLKSSENVARIRANKVLSEFQIAVGLRPR